MRKGDRVGYAAGSGATVQTGTVAKASSAGYVQVHWDKGGIGYFSPITAKRLRLLDSGEAVKTHWWIDQGIETVCRRCGVAQSDNNQHEHCA